MKRIFWIKNLVLQDKARSESRQDNSHELSQCRLGIQFSKHAFLLALCLSLGWTASRAAAASQGAGTPNQEVSMEAVVSSGLRGGALVPTGSTATAAHNREMLEAMDVWNAHRWAEGVERFRRIWQQSPDSPWAAEAELHEACYLKFNCRYDEAEERFLSVLNKHPDNDGVRKKVFYYLPHLYALTGRLDDAVTVQQVLGEYKLNWQEQQFLENQGRLLTGARKAQDDGRLCGTKALALAQAAAERERPEGLANVSDNDIFAKRPWALERSSHPDGYSIADLLRRGGGEARRISFEELRTLARPGRPVIAYLDVPHAPKVYAALGRSEPQNRKSLTGHFLVVERAEDGYLDALDPINGGERWDACMFQARWSGIVLLPAHVGVSLGQPLDTSLGESLRGGCCGSPPGDPVGGCTWAASTGGGRNGPSTSVSGPGASAGGCSSCGYGGVDCPCDSYGAPSYLFGLPSANLVVMDTPMWYPHADGPAMKIQLVYNRINSGILTNTPQFNYYTFGNKWSFNYNSFVKVTPGNNIEVVMPDGRVLAYMQSLQPVDKRNYHVLTLEGGYYRLKLEGSGTSYYYSTNTAAQAGQQVERIVDRFGQAISMYYNGTGQLTNVTDDIGRFFTLQYNGGGFVTNVIDSIGRSCSFDYSNGNLTSMTDLGGYTTTLDYNDTNWVTSVVYPNSSALQITHETGPQIYPPYNEPYRMRVIDSLGRTNEYLYHAFLAYGPVTVTDVSGNAWGYKHDAELGTKVPAIVTEGVNDRSFAQDTFDADWWTSRGIYSYTHQVQNETQYASVTPSNVIGLVRAFKYYVGFTTNGFTTNYFSTTWMTEETWSTNAVVMAAWSNDYDTVGNRIYTRDPLGAVTRTVYNTNNLPIFITNAIEKVTSMEYDTHGNLTRSVNPRLAETLWKYDSSGLCTNVTLADGTSTRMAYDSIGRLMKTTDPIGLTVSNQYDNLDRITDVWFPDATHTHYSFSCCGLDSVTDRLGRQTTSERDILGRVTNVVDAANQRVGFAYGTGGEITNLIVWVDGAPRTTRFGHTSANGHNRLTQRTSPLSKTTGYDYYYRGWLKTRTDGASRVTQYQYDALGRLKAINYPGNTNVTMGYDAVGHVTSLVNNNGSSTFAYDLLGRLASATNSLGVPGMTAVQYAVEYAYDTAGNVTNRTLRGLSGFTQVIPTRYDYDAMNRLTLVTNAVACASNQYTTGRLSAKIYSNGDTVSYDYDLESRLTNLAIRAGGQTLQTFAYHYDAMGMMRSADSVQVLGVSTNYQEIDYVYDPVYQLTQEVVQVNGSVTTNYWKYDEAGNVLKAPGQFGTAQASANADNELTSWTQVANQLTVTGQVDAGPRSNKWYDSTAQARGQSAWVNTSDGAFSILGVPVTPGVNVLTATVTDVSGNVATQFVSFTVAATNQWGFTYDSNGNMAAATNQLSAFSYGYDAESRLTTVMSNGVAVLQCWYDGSGHRVAKREIVGAQTNAVQYVWDEWTLVAVLGSDGQLKEHYTRGVGVAGDIGSIVATTHYTNGSATATYYLHNNHRGDVIMARQGTNTVATLDYAPYGELCSQTGTYTPRFRFSSKEYDASTGFYHFPFRYFAPQWARWVTWDRIMEQGGDPNLYRYVRNCPMKFIDPLGLTCAELHACYQVCDELWFLPRWSCRRECRRLNECLPIFEACSGFSSEASCQECCDTVCERIPPPFNEMSRCVELCYLHACGDCPTAHY